MLDLMADRGTAIRHGVPPDGTSELVMPSRAYARSTDPEPAMVGFERGASASRYGND